MVALSGKQVAVVVPTTLLARQHFRTFSDRFRGLAVQVAQASRRTALILKGISTPVENLGGLRTSGLDVDVRTGFSLPGLPAVIVGSNGHVADLFLEHGYAVTVVDKNVDGYYLMASGDTNLPTVGGTWSTGNDNVTGGTRLTANVWTHLAATFDGGRHTPRVATIDALLPPG